MKKTALLILSIGLLAFNCEEAKPDNCLPYEGKIFSFGKLCTGIVIKVTNKNINSSWDTGDEVVENVIEIRANPNETIIDSTLIDKKFYFDFRELKPEERDKHPCPTIGVSPTRKVFITQLSLKQCPTTEQ